MISLTIAFALLSFNDVKTAALSSSSIPRSELHSRVILMKTNQGNYAKLYVQSGDNLFISDLVVYNPQGCIIKTAKNLFVQSSFFFDVDNAVQLSTVVNSDIWWHGISAGNHMLEVKNGTTMTMLADFDDVTFSNVSTATFVNKKIKKEWLERQIIYCKTSEGRYAKMQVEWGASLLIRKLVVYNANGTVFLSKSNFTIGQTNTYDLDTDTHNGSGADIWWQAESATVHSLTPRNGATLSFESYYKYEKYFPLLANAPIRSAMIITGASDRNYDSWTDIEKMQLQEFNWLLETGQPLPISAPPALTADVFMSNCDAIKIYMAHVAQSLWADANNKVSWDITGAGTDHLEHLFDMRKLMKFTSGSGYSFEFGVMGGVTDWNPQLSYKFLIDSNLLKATQWLTIQAVTDWVRARLNHIPGFNTPQPGGPFVTQQDQWEYLFGYRGLPLVDKMISPLPGKIQTTHGCWGTDGFLAAVLRSVNIPVKHGRSNLSGNHHSRAEFFTVGRNLRHGDDPYNGWMRLGFNNVPVDRIFMTNAQLTNLIDAPVPLPGKTVPETASFNHGKFYVDLAIEFKTNYLLKYRCQDKSSGINNGPGSAVWQQLHEYFTDAQIATIVADCDVAINAIAGGCSSIGLY